MAIGFIPPTEEPASIDETEPISCESTSSSPFAGVHTPSGPPDEDDIDDDDGSFTDVALVETKRPRSSRLIPASLGSSSFCRKRFSSARSQPLYDDAAAHARSLARLSRHLAALRALIPSAARSGKEGNVIADALRYKKALSNEIDVLYRAFPYAKQVNVQRIGVGALQIEVVCEKRPGLLAALVEAIESSGIIASSINVSCRCGKIMISVISTQASSQQTASLKGTLMAAIMLFNS